MKHYELTCLIPAELSEQELNILQEKIIALLRQQKCLKIELEKPFRKQLFSPIKKKSLAFMMVTNFQCEPEHLENIEKTLKSESQLLHFMILNKKPLSLAMEKPRRHLEPVKAKQKVEIEEIDKKLEEILGEKDESK